MGDFFAVKVCHGAADLLHTYFCCIQWHASAFDERHEDDAFLHTQTPSTRAEEANSVAADDGTGQASGRSSPAKSSPAKPSPAKSSPARSIEDGKEGTLKKRLSGIFSRFPFPAAIGSASDRESERSPRVCSVEEASDQGDGEGDGTDPRVSVLHELLSRQRSALWHEMESKMVSRGSVLEVPRRGPAWNFVDIIPPPPEGHPSWVAFVELPGLEGAVPFASFVGRGQRLVIVVEVFWQGAGEARYSRGSPGPKGLRRGRCWP